MGKMFDILQDQMNNWRSRDNPSAIRNLVHSSNPETTCSGIVQRTGDHVSWYRTDDPRAMIGPPRCQQFKLGDMLRVPPPNCDVLIDEDVDDGNSGYSGEPSGSSILHGDGKENNDSEGGEDMEGGGIATGKGKGTQDGMGKRKRRRKAKDEGKGAVEHTAGEMISLVSLLYCCRSNCMRQIRTRRAT